VNDFLVGGGLGFTVLAKEPPGWRRVDIDAFTAYFKNHSPVASRKTGSIRTD
jgi:hypothetical protein